MKTKPLGEKILVKRFEAEEKTAGGILLPDAAKEKPKEGKIIALGDGKLLDSGKEQSFRSKKGIKWSLHLMQELRLILMVKNTC